MVFFKLAIVFVLQWLEVAGVRTAISPSYLWPLRFVYNKKVPVVPPLDIHGEVTNDDVGLRFDGKTAWLDAGELTGSCIAQPDKCVNGLSVAMRVKLGPSFNDSRNSSDTGAPHFLFDSGGFNGQGVSIYVKNGEVTSEVADKKKFWRVTTKMQWGKWHFVLLTWSPQDGIIVFVNGPIAAQNAQPMNFKLNPVATSDHVILGRCNAETGLTFAEFSSDLVAIFDSVTPDGKIYLSYSFSAPSTRGNIRYVNAKFINMADFDLIIFPDRGEHQKEGYQLEPHSSTLLEYVLREGPLPIGMNFRLQNKRNGEQLRYNDQYDFHVISSDDKQVVKEYKVFQDSTIAASVSTSAVRINYQIKAATVSIEPQTAGGGPPKPVTVGAEATSQEDQKVLIDNPEIPLDEESGTNTTNSNITAMAAASSISKEGNQTEQNKTSESNKQAAFPQMTTTIAPTLPPPPQYTTMKPKPNVTNSNGTSRPMQGSESGISSPEFPDDEQKLTAQEMSMNGTNGKSLNDTEKEFESMLEGVEAQSNSTNGSGPTNRTSTSGTGNANTSSSPNVNETGAKGGLPDRGSLSSSGQVNESSTNDTKYVTSPIGVGSNVEKSGKNGTQIEGKDKERPSQTASGQNQINLKPAGEKQPVNVNINSPNPWLGVAKETQKQQQQPILWHNGQGVHEAIQAKGIQGNLATINYNKDARPKYGERPVWQHVNEAKPNTEWLAGNKFKSDSNTINTSPFKFANTKTQQETMSFYDQKKQDKTESKKAGSITDDKFLQDLF